MGVVRVCCDGRPGEVWELRLLATWGERLCGLLGTTPDARPVLLARCGSIHTLGMRYALDVAFVGERGEVLGVRRGLGPGALASQPGARCTVERPARDGPWLEEGDRLWVVSASLDVAGT